MKYMAGVTMDPLWMSWITTMQNDPQSVMDWSSWPGQNQPFWTTSEHCWQLLIDWLSRV